MKVLFTVLFALATLFSSGQTPNEPRVIPPLRQQIFGVSNVVYDLKKYEFDTTGLAYFANGYLLTREEFRDALRRAGLSDTTQNVKTKFLNDLILSRQKIFEAMDQNLDTSTTFQLNFLKYKQELITPYLNEGRTRLEAEALPEVKFSLRQYYGDQLLHALQTKEIWSQDTDPHLQEFFNEHPELYQGQPYSISKTKVVYDYNKKLESELTVRVKSKFPYVVNSTSPK